MTEDATALSEAGARAGSEITRTSVKAVIGCLLGQMLGSSLLAFGALPLVMVPMTQEFGWSQPAFAWAVTCLMIGGACSGPIVGRYADRTGVRRTIMAGTLAVGLVTLSLALLQGTLAFFYIAYTLLGAFGSAALGYVKIISALFRRNRAKALAVFGAEATLAGALTPLIVNAILSQYGWRAVFLVLGLVILATLPIQFALLVEPARNAPSRQQAVPGFASAQRARMSSTYWLLIAAVLLAAAPRLGFMTYIVPVLAEKGFSTTIAAWVIAGITIAAPLGSLVAGALMDRFQTPGVAIPLFGVALLATILLAIITTGRGGLPALVMGAVLFGLTLQIHIPMLSYFLTRYFGLDAFTENYGVAVAVLAVGIGVMAPVLGYASDAAGSNDALFLISGVALIASMTVFRLLPPFPAAKS